MWLGNLYLGCALRAVCGVCGNQYRKGSSAVCLSVPCTVFDLSYLTYLNTPKTYLSVV